MAVVASRAFKSGLVLLAVLAFLSGVTSPSVADVPLIVSMRQDPEEPYNLLVTVVHEDSSSEHYVDLLEFSVDNRTAFYHDSYLQPQEEEEFTVTYNCLIPCHVMQEGLIKDREVKVRARDTLHGWSAWSEVVDIIEFTPLLLLATVTALGIGTVAARRRLRHRR